MELHIHFDAAVEPRKQQGLRAIPSSTIVDHAEIKTAIERYETALADEHEARLSAVQAEQDLGEADELDAVALADALAASKRDPGAKHREAALQRIEDTRRQHRASTILLQRAVEDVNAAFAEQGADYERELHERDEALREQSSRCLDEYAALLERMRRNRACLQIGRTGSPVGLDRVSLPGRKANGEALTVSPEEMLEKLRALGAPKEPRPVPVRSGWNQSTRMPQQAISDAVRELDPEASTARQVMRETRLARRAGRAAEREARLEAESEAIEAAR